MVGGGGPSSLFMGAGNGPSSLLVVVVLVGPRRHWWGLVMGRWWVVVVVCPHHHLCCRCLCHCHLCCRLIMACCRHCMPLLLLLLPAIIVIVVACCRLHRVLPGLCCVIVGHLVLGLANSKGEGGLTSSLFIVWWPCCRLRRGTWVALWFGWHGWCCCGCREQDGGGRKKDV